MGAGGPICHWREVRQAYVKGLIRACCLGPPEGQFRPLSLPTSCVTMRMDTSRPLGFRQQDHPAMLILGKANMSIHSISSSACSTCATRVYHCLHAHQDCSNVSILGVLSGASLMHLNFLK